MPYTGIATEWVLEKKKNLLFLSWSNKQKEICYVHNIFTIFSQQITGDQLLLVQIWT